MGDVERFRSQVEHILDEKTQIIEELLIRLQAQQEMITILDSSVAQFHDGYIKSSLTELEDLGYVLTNGIGDKCQKFLFLNVSNMNPQLNVIYHKDSEIVVAEQIGDYIVPTEISQKVQYSNNFCEMLIKDLHRLQETIAAMQEEITKLSIEKNQLTQSLNNKNIAKPRVKHQTTLAQKPQKFLNGEKRPRTHKGISRSNASKNKSQNYDIQENMSPQKVVSLENESIPVINGDQQQKKAQKYEKPSVSQSNNGFQGKIQSEPDVGHTNNFHQDQLGQKSSKVPMYIGYSQDQEEDKNMPDNKQKKKTIPTFQGLFPTYQYNNPTAPEQVTYSQSPTLQNKNQLTKNQEQKKRPKKLINLYSGQKDTQKGDINTSQQKHMDKFQELKIPSLVDKRGKNSKQSEEELHKIPLSPLVRKKNHNSKIIYVRK